jgi:predicted DNA-binding antitoxin AbrB/MazE fold protein
MLVVEGFFENGVFVPQKPLVNIKGRQNAILTIAEDEEKERLERITAWRQFGEAVLNSDEVLEGEPERFQFRTFE